jgi:hypothetical protein
VLLTDVWIVRRFASICGRRERNSIIAPKGKVVVNSCNQLTAISMRLRNGTRVQVITGANNKSDVPEGTIIELARTDVIAIHLNETPAHSSYELHPA